MTWMNRSLISRLLGEKVPHGPESIADDVTQLFSAIDPDAWKHVSTHEMGIGGQVASPHSGELSSFLDRYDATPQWLKTKQLNWLLADGRDDRRLPHARFEPPQLVD